MKMGNVPLDNTASHPFYASAKEEVEEEIEKEKSSKQQYSSRGLR